ncbi:MAG: YidC/Oxa1 family membrane protein insertase, partial [Clostridia bacterium]|nr:YidC/Oxa1 family membrane protein insertase [Clostridia bacterium]
MSFLSILDGILLKPLMLLFEVIFVVAARITKNAGLSIFLLSMSMNLLVLPLYRRSDMLQEEERQIQEKLRAGVDHIKKTFKGDERMMILQTYYRQNHYKPAYALRGSISLLLQIPFFLAAYRYLSTLRLLENVPMGFIADLAKPDGALTIAGLTINVLPIIMTGVNLISCVIYTKGSPLKSKLQLYGMALFFLFFLYDSPAGLVFYWTLNNLFSLAKTILYKLKNPKRVIGGIASVVGVVALLYALAFLKTPGMLLRVGLIGFGILLQMPIALPLLRRKFPAKCNHSADKSSSAAFLTGAMFLALLTGALIPSSVIKASPLDFVNVNMYYNPLWYVVSSLCMSTGVFIVWGGIFYRLASVKGRVLMEHIVWL